MVAVAGGILRAVAVPRVTVGIRGRLIGPVVMRLPRVVVGTTSAVVATNSRGFGPALSWSAR